jgi:hypothetical protein
MFNARVVPAIAFEKGTLARSRISQDEEVLGLRI